MTRLPSTQGSLSTLTTSSDANHGYPKGTHCCVQCTLAVYPVLEANAIRYFDCAELAESLRRLVRERQRRFSKPANPKMTRWALH